MSALRIEHQGTEYSIDLDNLTALDAADFRNQVGRSLTSVMGGDFDLDGVAGLLWLAKRKGNRKLDYRTVAATVTYKNVRLVAEEEDEDSDPPAEEEVELDPEA